MIFRHLPAAAALLALLIFPVLCSAQDKPTKKKPVKRKPNPAFAKVEDDAKLPRVLLIGDSISVGYTTATRELLQGKANLHRIGTNGGPTIKGLDQIDAWLGKENWDVIHFNWGLHDLRQDKPSMHQVPIDQYGTNLEKLVLRLKKTGAKLIWCSTTPVPEGATRRKPGDEVSYNEVAAAIMKKHEVPTDDLYTFALERLEQIQMKANVHFTREGSKTLAQQVAGEIEKALKP